MDANARYNQLIQDLRMELRPQREWGDGKGLYLVVGHFFNGLACGSWLFSLIFEQSAGLLAAYLLGIIGGVTHLMFLGRPARFWRMVRQQKTAWVSRGFLGLSLFLSGATLYLLPIYLPGVLWSADSLLSTIGYGAALLGMIGIMGYMGFVYTASKAVPFWNSPLHPALYVSYSLRGGVAVLFVTTWLVPPVKDLTSTLLPLWGGITAVVGLLFALEIHGALTGGNEAARRSVRDLLAGRVSGYFYVGTLALGLVVPAYFMYAGMSGTTATGLMAMLGLTSAGGDFFMKFSTLRAGVFLPVWTHMSHQRR